jgi:hypothetical protein
MKYQLIAYRDGAKRYYQFFIDGVPDQHLWTGDGKGWVKSDTSGKTYEDSIKSGHILYTSECDDLHHINEMLEGVRKTRFDGYQHEAPNMTPEEVRSTGKFDHMHVHGKYVQEKYPERWDEYQKILKDRNNE